MTYDTHRRRPVVFGGAGQVAGYLNDTWSWDGTSWAQSIAAAPPGPRDAHGMAYHAASGRMVVLSGNQWFTGPWDDTWLYYSRGGGCAQPSDCASGFCTDGVCCDASACGTCQSSRSTRKSGQTCSPVTNAADPGTCSESAVVRRSGNKMQPEPLPAAETWPRIA